MNRIPSVFFSNRPGLLAATTVLILCQSVALANPANAVWEATGFVTTIGTVDGTFEDFPNLYSGAPFTVTFEFEPSSQLTDQNEGTMGMRYRYANSIVSVSLVVGEDELVREADAYRALDIWDDYTPEGQEFSPEDGLYLGYGVVSNTPGGFAPITLTFRGPHPLDMFSGPGLPARPPEGLADLNISRFQFRDGFDQIQGRIRTVRSLAPDSDGDGLADDEDNCLAVANPLQRDTDADGFGNLCDADLNNDCVVNVIDLGLFRSVFFSDDPHADFDGDGVVNVADLGMMKPYFYEAPGPAAGGLCADL